MDLLVAVVSGFVLAPLLPVMHRWLGDRVAYAAAALPLAIAVYFGSPGGGLGAGEERVADFRWVPGLDLALTLRLDGLSLLFVLVIAGVGVLVTVYAGGYFAGHRRLGMFCAYMAVFTAAMLGLVLAGNVLTLYVFWELTTLSSFLLIGFEHRRDTARTAAVQALLTTALGGLAMLVGLVLLGLIGGTFDLVGLTARGADVRADPLYPAALVLILLGAFTKSAQFPFHFWLPNAMEAPTPVSAFLHSATMVKAGVYLLARLLPVLGGTDLWTLLVTSVGAVTMLLGAVLAIRQHDLKGVLAYLTVNVLGTLVMLLGIGTPHAVEAAMTYLLAHALYKGALFLMVGAVDHGAHTRDVRELGGLARRMPLSAAVAVLAAVSMAGIAPLFGFVAKELYLAAVWEAPAAAWWLTVVSLAASAFVVAGAGVVALRPFFGRTTPATENAREAGARLWIGPLLLAAAGVALGLFPQRLAGPLLEPAVFATRGEATPFTLSLWHGVTVPLLLSVAALVGGALLYAGRERLLRLVPDEGWAERWARRWGPEALYGRSVAAMNAVAAWQTRLLQSGFIRWYVLTIVAVTVALVGAMIAHLGSPFPRRDPVDVKFHEGVASVLILAGALVAVRSGSRRLAVAALGVVGFNIAWLYALFGAPDLAMTQLVVESLTVVLLLLAFSNLPKFTIQSTRATRVRDAALAAAAGVTMTALLLFVTTFRRHAPISDYFLKHSVELAHGRNAVNVILVDFRAMDTLGEITVLATAAVGVYALLRLSGRQRPRSLPGDGTMHRLGHAPRNDPDAGRGSVAIPSPEAQACPTTPRP